MTTDVNTRVENDKEITGEYENQYHPCFIKHKAREIYLSHNIFHTEKEIGLQCIQTYNLTL